ncbi:DUF2314 domain-containing protein [Mucilaginibacter terrae]|uniref:Uncharacterized protein YegJ (DUF2314 family) n=1 Tax=Mucilaginibacter terrae TaxID=1955052 RepID=A0ABU3GSH9_9SPHI|nr:DUF2314 domain-containing protein [Mucilaginibacter terrae]MDT3402702.1 uncharacterized protein YegJ (DUF2314 family) [Mucilaginibacter terrae]
MKKLFVYAGLLLLSLQACNNTSTKKPDTVVGLVKEDRTFLALKDTAQSKMSQFVDSLKRHADDEKNYIFAVKSDFVDKGEHEHMWSRVFALQNGTFQGMLVDSPYVIKNIKIQDEVTVPLKDVEDWVIYDEVHHKKLGSFSSEYLKSKR